MIEISLFVTEDKSQIKPRLQLIKEICELWMNPDLTITGKDYHDDFNQIFSIVRNIEMEGSMYRRFENYKHIDRMIRETVPQIGDTIVIDCGEMVEVIHVSHQWDNPDLVQVMSRRVEI